MLRLSVSAPELAAFGEALRSAPHRMQPVLDSLLIRIADHIAQLARENTRKVYPNLAGGDYHGGYQLATTIVVGSTAPATVYYGGGLGYAGGAEFGSERYRQFPTYNDTGYILGAAIDDAGSREFSIDNELLDEFFSRAFPF